MMKKWKRRISIFLVIAMMLAMNCTAFAAEATPPQAGEGAGITAQADEPQKDDFSKHRFVAYQIFAGTSHDVTVEGENLQEFLAIQWGDGVKAAELIASLKGGDFGTTPNPFAEVSYDASDPKKSANAVAKVVSGWDTYSQEAGSSQAAKEFAKLVEKNLTSKSYKPGDTIPAGYYLVVDVTEFEDGIVDAAKNPSVLMATTEESIFAPENKSSVPTLKKEVKEIDDSTGSSETGTWQHTADYDIGDEVEFKLTGTLPENYADYTKYKYKFQDTLGVGMELLEDSVQVRLVNQKDADGKPIDPVSVEEGFKITVATGASQGFELAFDDLKDSGIFPYASSVSSDTEIVVEYKARLLPTAVVGSPGNPNTAYVVYSNNPNLGGEGETGKTPEDKVVVFTYQLIINKVKPGQSADTTVPLEGAGFSLFKLNSATQQYEPVHVSPNEEGEYVVLSDLTGHTHSTPVQPTTPDAGQGNNNETGGGQDENGNGGSVNPEAAPGANGNAGGSEGLQAQSNPEEKAELKKELPVNTVNYCEIGGKDSKITKFVFKGLDAGQYVLMETTVPEGGYNKIDDLYFTVAAVQDEKAVTENPNQVLTQLEITDVRDAYGRKEVVKAESGTTGTGGDTETPVFVFTPVIAEGSLTTSILNMTGTLLPATGGIGTTIFYVLGGILVVGAAVLLIIRRRTKKDE